MATEGVKLFGRWTSPFVHRVAWALKVKGVEYEYIEEDLSNKIPLLLQYNPVHKKVPVLVHDGQPVIESAVILEYIDQTSKQNPILPEDPYQRAMARFWANFAEEKCIHATWNAFCSDGEERVKAIESVVEALRILEGQVKGKFFGGEFTGFLDIMVAWIAHWLGVFEEVGEMKVVDSMKLPSLTRWIEEFRQVPVIDENLPPRDEMVAYFSKFKQITQPRKP